jgi:quinol monooxygenase YgiN
MHRGAQAESLSAFAWDCQRLRASSALRSWLSSRPEGVRWMIFIAVKFKVKHEYADQWTDIVNDFTQATRSEPGNLWFQWSRSVDDPDEYVLLEAFKDDAAGSHVSSDHFAQFTSKAPDYLQETPQIRNTVLEGDDWERMSEITVA